MGSIWSSLDTPGIRIHLSHPILELGEFPFPHYWPSGVIRIGLPSMKVKSWKIIRTKGAKKAANGPVRMPQALKTHCLI